MIPQNFKQLFGLNSQKDVSMANNIWKMLDQMAQSSPQKYQQFIQKNIKQGVQDVKQKKDQKQKPFKLKPQKGFILQFHMNLNQKYISPNQLQKSFQAVKISQTLTQKLDINSQKWQTIKKKFNKKIHVVLNICFTDRVKLPLNKMKKQLEKIRLDQVKDIQVFYYSLQGPFQSKNNQHNLPEYQYCMILNQNVYESLIKQAQHGKKMLMSLSISYFQQRIQTDRNFLFKIYDPQKYGKLAYYTVQKQSIQIITQKPYFYNNSEQMAQFLLQRDVDKNRQQQIKEQEQKKLQKIKQQQKQKDIKLRPQQKDNDTNIKKSQNINLSSNNRTNNESQNKIAINSSQTKKKPLIQVLNQTQETDPYQEQLPYQLKQTEQGYHIEILTPGVTNIQSLDLQISDKQIKLKLQKSKNLTTIDLKNLINSQQVKAKLKKKISRLIIDAPFLNYKK